MYVSNLSPLLRVAALPSKRRDPCSEICEAGLSKKWGEAPRDPCSEIRVYQSPKMVFREGAGVSDATAASGG